MLTELLRKFDNVPLMFYESMPKLWVPDSMSKISGSGSLKGCAPPEQQKGVSQLRRRLTTTEAALEASFLTQVQHFWLPAGHICPIAWSALLKGMLEQASALCDRNSEVR